MSAPTQPLGSTASAFPLIGGTTTPADSMALLLAQWDGSTTILIIRPDRRRALWAVSAPFGYRDTGTTLRN